MELITVSSIKEIDMSDLSLPLIVMYDHPLDYPDYIVARVWEGKYAAPTNTAILYKNISEAERELDIYQKVPRHPGDDPCIICSYLPVAQGSGSHNADE